MSGDWLLLLSPDVKQRPKKRTPSRFYTRRSASASAFFFSQPVRIGPQLVSRFYCSHARLYRWSHQTNEKTAAGQFGRVVLFRHFSPSSSSLPSSLFFFLLHLSYFLFPTSSLLFFYFLLSASFFRHPSSFFILHVSFFPFSSSIFFVLYFFFCLPSSFLILPAVVSFVICDQRDKSG